MVNRRKQGFSAARSKITSHRMRSATVGTHVPKRPGGRMNADKVGFSSARKQKRAARGYVDTLLPSTSSRESSSEYARRVSRREFTQEIQRQARTRRIVAAAVCCVVAVAIAAVVGLVAFFGSIDAKMALGESDAASALAAASGEAFYTVVAADLDEEGRPGAVEGPDALALVRFDAAARSATVVSIPPNLQVRLGDGEVHQLREASVREGDAALVNAVADFAEVDVSHFVKIDAAGIVALVDALGGIDVDVVEEVDDPVAGDVYIPAGKQALDGRSALTLLRASNLSEGVESQAANQRALLAAVALRMPADGPLGFLTLIDGAGGTFRTDMGVLDALRTADAVRGMDAGALYGVLVPGYGFESDGTSYYAASTDEWSAMMELVDAGEDPAAEAPAPDVDPASFTLTVRNGTDLAGAAAQLSGSLAERGYQVKETGNTDAHVYKETLVIYDDDKFQAAAQSVVGTLGIGRTVASNGSYTFETDVLVILGSDWKPAS